MYHTLLITHSLLRYFVLLLLLVVLFRSFVGWRSNKAIDGIDNKASLWLLILTHTQLLLGLALYGISDFVKFSADSMKDSTLRYWLVEHITGMIIAVTLITIGRISSKKVQNGQSQKRLFVYNAAALIIILVMIALSHRGFFNLPVSLNN